MPERSAVFSQEKVPNLLTLLTPHTAYTAFTTFAVHTAYTYTMKSMHILPNLDYKLQIANLILT